MRFPTMWHFDMCDSDEPLHPHFKLRNSKCCSVSDLTVIEPLLVALPHCWKSHVMAQYLASGRGLMLPNLDGE